MLLEIIDRLLYIIFPRHCPCCDEITLNNAEICEECETKLLKMLLENACSVCGLPKEECTCKKKVYLFKGIAAPFRYESAAREGVLNIKRKKSYENAKFFAHYIAEDINEKFPDVKFDYVCSVPMEKSREFDKGFNHSLELAKYISKEIGVGYLPILNQIKKAESQHDLTYNERAKNVKGIYSVNEKYREEVAQKRILLVDDIKTSGSTLNECAHELLLSGADEVFCAVAAVTCKKIL